MIRLFYSLFTSFIKKINTFERVSTTEICKDCRSSVKQWKNNILARKCACSTCGCEPMDIVRDKNNDKHCWKCYQKIFIAHETPWIYNWDRILAELRNEYGDCVYVQETFLGYWNKHERLRCALKNNGVHHCFVYIKGYLDKEDNTYPIVAGKSSITDKYKGDINFSLNPKLRTARCLLYYNCLNWDSKKNIVIPCKTKKEALEVESIIQKKYHLLGS